MRFLAALASSLLIAALGATDRKAINAGIRDSAPPLPAQFSWPPGLAQTQQLRLTEAIAVALWNNTALEADLAAFGVAKADLLEAGLLRNPNFWSLLPVGGKPFETLLNWPVEEWWQRKKRVRAAQVNVDAVAKGLEQNGLNLIRDVALAHADLWLASQRAVTLAESATLRERIAALTEKRREAGDATGIEVSLAAADARSAGEVSRRALSDIAIARARLSALLGMRGDNGSLEAIGEVAAPSALTENALVEFSLTSRPDLRAAELSAEAAAQRAKWQRTRVLNMLTAILSVKPSGTPAETRAGPGLQFEIPIFNRNQGQVARADADVIQAGWRYAALRDRVEQDVRESYRRTQQAIRSSADLQTGLRPMVEQSIEQAEQAFRNGDASRLSVIEATRIRFDVQLRQVDAEAGVRRALAELERSVGKTL